MSAQPSETRIDDRQKSLVTRVDLSPTDPDQAANATAILDFLAAHETKHGRTPAPTFYLAGAESGDRVELSSKLHQLLKDVVEAVSAGKSVSILSSTEEVTTQQAAEILGLSRPTVVDLIERGELAACVPGRKRRKLLLVDVLSYRDALRARRNEFIEESSAAYDFAGDISEEDMTDVLDRARRTQQR